MIPRWIWHCRTCGAYALHTLRRHARSFRSTHQHLVTRSGNRKHRVSVYRIVKLGRDGGRH